MTTKRMVQLRVHPLTHGELVNALSSRDPVYREEEEAFLSNIIKFINFSRILNIQMLRIIYFFFKIQILLQKYSLTCLKKKS